MPRSTEVAIDDRLMATLEALPLRKCGQRKREPTEAQKVALRKYGRSGRSVLEMAAAFGVSGNVFRRWVREYSDAG